MYYRISINPSYSLTVDDLQYLEENNMKYKDNAIIMEATEPYQLARYKSAIRRIPSQLFYDNLIDDFGPFKKRVSTKKVK